MFVAARGHRRDTDDWDQESQESLHRCCCRRMACDSGRHLWWSHWLQTCSGEHNCVRPLPEHVEFSKETRSAIDRMQKASQIVSKPLVSASERQVIPGEI